MVGPLLGGFLVDAGSWRLVFAINVVPITLTLVLMRGLMVAEHIRLDTKIDFVGAFMCALGLGGTVFALIEQPNYGWSSPIILAPLLLGAAFLTLFMLYESRIMSPMLPLKLFRVRNFSVGNLATTAIYAGLAVATFLLVIFVQQVGHYSALQAGMSLLPVTVIMFVVSPRFGALAGRFGPRLFMGLGPIVAAAGFLLMLRVDQSVFYWTQLLPGIIVFGIGLAMTVAPLTAAILADIEKSYSGIASAVNNAIARIAGLVATAAIGIIVGQQLTLIGFEKGVVFMAILLAAGGIVSLIGIQNPKTTATSGGGSASVDLSPKYR